MIVHQDPKNDIVSHPVASKQPHFAIQILMGHPVPSLFLILMKLKSKTDETH